MIWLFYHLCLGILSTYDCIKDKTMMELVMLNLSFLHYTLFFYLTIITNQYLSVCNLLIIWSPAFILKIYYTLHSQLHITI